MEAPTVPMFVPAVALDHSDHALSEPKKGPIKMVRDKILADDLG
jgi:hypothetical protein